MAKHTQFDTIKLQYYGIIFGGARQEWAIQRQIPAYCAKFVLLQPYKYKAQKQPRQNFLAVYSEKEESGQKHLFLYHILVWIGLPAQNTPQPVWTRKISQIFTGVFAIVNKKPLTSNEISGFWQG